MEPPKSYNLVNPFRKGQNIGRRTGNPILKKRARRSNMDSFDEYLSESGEDISLNLSQKSIPVKENLQPKTSLMKNPLAQATPVFVLQTDTQTHVSSAHKETQEAEFCVQALNPYAGNGRYGRRTGKDLLANKPKLLANGMSNFSDFFSDTDVSLSILDTPSTITTSSTSTTPKDTDGNLTPKSVPKDTDGDITPKSAPKDSKHLPLPELASSENPHGMLHIATDEINPSSVNRRLIMLSSKEKSTCKATKEIGNEKNTTVNKSFNSSKQVLSPEQTETNDDLDPPAEASILRSGKVVQTKISRTDSSVRKVANMKTATKLNKTKNSSVMNVSTGSCKGLQRTKETLSFTDPKLVVPSTLTNIKVNSFVDSDESIEAGDYSPQSEGLCDILFDPAEVGRLHSDGISKHQKIDLEKLPISQFFEKAHKSLMKSKNSSMCDQVVEVFKKPECVIQDPVSQGKKSKTTTDVRETNSKKKTDTAKTQDVILCLNFGGDMIGSVSRTDQAPDNQFFGIKKRLTFSKAIVDSATKLTNNRKSFTDSKWADLSLLPAKNDLSLKADLVTADDVNSSPDKSLTSETWGDFYIVDEPIVVSRLDKDLKHMLKKQTRKNKSEHIAAVTSMALEEVRSVDTLRKDSNLSSCKKTSLKSLKRKESNTQAEKCELNNSVSANMNESLHIKKSKLQLNTSRKKLDKSSSIALKTPDFKEKTSRNMEISFPRKSASRKKCLPDEKREDNVVDKSPLNAKKTKHRQSSLTSENENLIVEDNHTYASLKKDAKKIPSSSEIVDGCEIQRNASSWQDESESDLSKPVTQQRRIKQRKVVKRVNMKGLKLSKSQRLKISRRKQAISGKDHGKRKVNDSKKEKTSWQQQENNEYDVVINSFVEDIDSGPDNLDGSLLSKETFSDERTHLGKDPVPSVGKNQQRKSRKKSAAPENTSAQATHTVEVEVNHLSSPSNKSANTSHRGDKLNKSRGRKNMSSSKFSTSRTNNSLSTPRHLNLLSSLPQVTPKSGVSFRPSQHFKSQQCEGKEKPSKLRSLYCEDGEHSPEDVTTPSNRKSTVLTSCLRDSSTIRPRRVGRRVRISQRIDQLEVSPTPEDIPAGHMTGYISGLASMSASPVHYAETTTNVKVSSPSDSLDVVLPDLSHKIVRPDLPTQPGLRRSKRTRVMRLNRARGERIIYRRDSSGFGLVVDGIQPSIGEAKVKALEEKRRKNLLRKRMLSTMVPSKIKKRLSMHRPPEGDVTMSSQVPVVNPETDTEMLLDCISRQRSITWYGPDLTPVQPADSLAVGLLIQQPSFSTGELHMRPFSEKPLGVATQTLVYYVIVGKVSVTINRATTVADIGDSFFIPRGNDYSLKNLRRDIAKLFFIDLGGHCNDTESSGSSHENNEKRKVS